MPNRILREAILTSSRVNALSWPAEVFYRRLMSIVDDHGLADARPTLLRAQLYPLKLERVSESDIGKWKRETAEAALVRFYSVEGREYLQLLDFKQQTRSNPKYPLPVNGDCEQLQSIASNGNHLPADAHLGVGVSVCVSGSTTAPAATTEKVTWTESTGLIITEGTGARLKQAFPACDIRRQAALAHEWLIANPAKRKKNYHSFFFRWLTNAQERGGDVRSKPTSAGWKGTDCTL